MCEYWHQGKGQRRRLWANRDPIPKLNPEMLYQQVKFVVEEADWGQQRQKVILGRGGS